MPNPEDFSDDIKNAERELLDREFRAAQMFGEYKSPFGPLDPAHVDWENGKELFVEKPFEDAVNAAFDGDSPVGSSYDEEVDNSY